MSRRRSSQPQNTSNPPSSFQSTESTRHPNPQPNLPPTTPLQPNNQTFQSPPQLHVNSSSTPHAPLHPNQSLITPTQATSSHHTTNSSLNSPPITHHPSHQVQPRNPNLRLNVQSTNSAPTASTTTPTITNQLSSIPVSNPSNSSITHPYQPLLNDAEGVSCITPRSSARKRAMQFQDPSLLPQITPILPPNPHITPNIVHPHNPQHQRITPLQTIHDTTLDPSTSFSSPPPHNTQSSSQHQPNHTQDVHSTTHLDAFFDGFGSPISNISLKDAVNRTQSSWIASNSPQNQPTGSTGVNNKVDGANGLADDSFDQFTNNLNATFATFNTTEHDRSLLASRRADRAKNNTNQDQQQQQQHQQQTHPQPPQPSKLNQSTFDSTALSLGFSGFDDISDESFFSHNATFADRSGAVNMNPTQNALNEAHTATITPTINTTSHNLAITPTNPLNQPEIAPTNPQSINPNTLPSNPPAQLTTHDISMNNSLLSLFSSNFSTNPDPISSSSSATHQPLRQLSNLPHLAALQQQHHNVNSQSNNNNNNNTNVPNTLSGRDAISRLINTTLNSTLNSTAYQSTINNPNQTGQDEQLSRQLQSSSQPQSTSTSSSLPTSVPHKPTNPFQQHAFTTLLQPKQHGNDSFMNISLVDLHTDSSDHLNHSQHQRAHHNQHNPNHADPTQSNQNRRNMNESGAARFIRREMNKTQVDRTDKHLPIMERLFKRWGEDFDESRNSNTINTELSRDTSNSHQNQHHQQYTHDSSFQISSPHAVLSQTRSPFNSTFNRTSEQDSLLSTSTTIPTSQTTSNSVLADTFSSSSHPPSPNPLDPTAALPSHLILTYESELRKLYPLRSDESLELLSTLQLNSYLSNDRHLPAPTASIPTSLLLAQLKPQIGPSLQSTLQRVLYQSSSLSKNQLHSAYQSSTLHNSTTHNTQSAQHHRLLNLSSLQSKQQIDLLSPYCSRPQLNEIEQLVHDLARDHQFQRALWFLEQYIEAQNNAIFDDEDNCLDDGDDFDQNDDSDQNLDTSNIFNSSHHNDDGFGFGPIRSSQHRSKVNRHGLKPSNQTKTASSFVQPATIQTLYVCNCTDHLSNSRYGVDVRNIGKRIMGNIVGEKNLLVDPFEDPLYSTTPHTTASITIPAPMGARGDNEENVENVESDKNLKISQTSQSSLFDGEFIVNLPQAPIITCYMLYMRVWLKYLLFLQQKQHSSLAHTSSTRPGGGAFPTGHFSHLTGVGGNGNNTIHLNNLSQYIFDQSGHNPAGHTGLGTIGGSIESIQEIMLQKKLSNQEILHLCGFFIQHEGLIRNTPGVKLASVETGIKGQTATISSKIPSGMNNHSPTQFKMITSQNRSTDGNTIQQNPLKRGLSDTSHHPSISSPSNLSSSQKHQKRQKVLSNSTTPAAVDPHSQRNVSIDKFYDTNFGATADLNDTTSICPYLLYLHAFLLTQMTTSTPDAFSLNNIQSAKNASNSSPTAAMTTTTTTTSHISGYFPSSTSGTSTGISVATPAWIKYLLCLSLQRLPSLWSSWTLLTSLITTPAQLSSLTLPFHPLTRLFVTKMYINVASGGKSSSSMVVGEKDKTTLVQLLLSLSTTFPATTEYTTIAFHISKLLFDYSLPIQYNTVTHTTTTTTSSTATDTIDASNITNDPTQHTTVTVSSTTPQVSTTTITQTHRQDDPNVRYEDILAIDPYNYSEMTTFFDFLHTSQNISTFTPLIKHLLANSPATYLSNQYCTTGLFMNMNDSGDSSGGGGGICGVSTHSNTLTTHLSLAEFYSTPHSTPHSLDSIGIDYEKAIHHYKQALLLSTTPATISKIWIQLALLFFYSNAGSGGSSLASAIVTNSAGGSGSGSGAKKLVIQCLYNAVQAHPDNSQGYYYLGYLSKLNKQYTIAIMWFEYCISKNKNNLSYWSELGHCYLSCGDYEQALRCFKVAVRIAVECDELRLLIPICITTAEVLRTHCHNNNDAADYYSLVLDHRLYSTYTAASTTTITDVTTVSSSSSSQNNTKQTRHHQSESNQSTQQQHAAAATGLPNWLFSIDPNAILFVIEIRCNQGRYDVAKKYLQLFAHHSAVATSLARATGATIESVLGTGSSSSAFRQIGNATSLFETLKAKVYQHG